MAISLRMIVGVCLLAFSTQICTAENRVTVDRNTDAATIEFKFKRVPAPSSKDAANGAKIRIVKHERDSNGGDVHCLIDGELPANSDSPGANFFFRQGSDGGRLLCELETAIEVQAIRTYSWHRGSRGPQVYRVYGSEADKPETDGDLPQAGWSLIASVDTRPENKDWGGQYGVEVAAEKAGQSLGKFRYLLFDLASTEQDDPFGNTFFSEIDVDDGQEHASVQPAVVKDVLKIGDQYEITFDTTDLPEIRPWVLEKLMPVCKEWYPKIVDFLPSENFHAPQAFKVVFHRDMDGVANTAGTQVNCAGKWFLRNRDGEAAGAVVHELVHVVQQYGRVRGRNRNPSWLVEGIADQVRWFQYEPEDQRPRVDPRRARYTDSYRTTAAFLDYLTKTHDPQIVTKFNAAMREGKYSDQLWQQIAGKNVDELWSEYVKTLQR